MLQWGTFASSNQARLLTTFYVGPAVPATCVGLSLASRLLPSRVFRVFFSGILFVPPIFPNFFFSIVLLPNCTTLCGGKKGKNDNTQLNAAVPCCCRSVPPRGILGLVLQGCYAEWTYIDNIAYPGIMHPEMLLWQGLIY